MSDEAKTNTDRIVDTIHQLASDRDEAQQEILNQLTRANDTLEALLVTMQEIEKHTAMIRGAGVLGT